MSNDLQSLLSANMLYLIGGSVAIIAILAHSVRTIVTSTSRERSRREIAAYIAEKAMTPEEGERLMNAGKHQSRC
jgi:hypothetical protein